MKSVQSLRYFKGKKITKSNKLVFTFNMDSGETVRKNPAEYTAAHEQGQESAVFLTNHGYSKCTKVENIAMLLIYHKNTCFF